MSSTTPEVGGVNSGYGSGDERSSLLGKAGQSSGKPVLMRQDCTTTLIVSPTPHLSSSGGLLGGSDESAGGVEETGARSVPDLEMHCRLRAHTNSRYNTSLQTLLIILQGAAQQPPALLLTASPGSRIVRQSSQPEAGSCCLHGAGHHIHQQLREPGDGIAMIAADSLRINGGIRQFKQVNSYTSLVYLHREPLTIQLSHPNPPAGRQAKRGRFFKSP
ncbi:hypothetical protein AAG570_004139 [Ranatra chinensis]|uniref:Uncharacterized protein n=1 Tax=Ranatra chinensis TaxID=642074 RepID=A0ABD0YPQ8_9HEMI